MTNSSGRRLLAMNGTIYAGARTIEDGRMLIGADGRIEAIGGAELDAEELETAGARLLDLGGGVVIPGLIDQHVHGGGGWQAMDATYEGLNGMSLYHASHGTTSFLATTESAAEAEILDALHNVAQAAAGRGLEGAELLGVHLEGPFLNPIRCGAQDKANIRPASPDELDRYLEAAGGLIRIVTLAPEIEGGMEAAERLSRAGVTLSVGHSDATLAQMREAIRRGAAQTTHHFNGMSPFHHREPGVAGAGLLCPELTTELIADGIHVHPDAVKLLYDVKGARGVCVITDAVYCAGLPDGEYGDTTMKDGQVWLKDGSSLAGSSLTMLQALRNVLRFTGRPLAEVLPSLTEVPARQIGVSGRKGMLEAGMDADFLVLNGALELQSTYVRGREVYSKKAADSPIG
ncbi:N-acetylglucosamine-6-phosphate deacetylase [Cohnella hashimotonis]|uniref:N-acetylglucosamine-6-phosphate deacetylase n=1 Tax=Cohnella hashimotonis TaxID=2826895 RepID=A0ABT6TNC2_9BACL|nr:N-acetylglucosamine-6-phosphate deacetylase [Cohnella hashimotonis]MDI4648245.1 N-acetylglucosamine-6-phosphate deacetylase [Cohnella hashimotonis]